MRHSRVTAIVLTIFLGGLAVADEPEPTAVPPEEAAAILEQLRRTDDPAQVAWGAWRAAEGRLGLAGPLVLQRLQDEAERPTPTVSWALSAVLLHAARSLHLLPRSDVLLAHAGRNPDGVVVLCRGAEAPAETLLALFDLFEERPSEDVAWLAVGNLLHARRAPGFARRVLSRWTKHYLLRVWDRPGPYPPWRGPRDTVPGDLFGAAPADFPPIPRYELEQEAGEGCELVAPGLRPVWVRSWFDRPGGRMAWSSNVGDELCPSRDAAREEWVYVWRYGSAELGTPPPDPPLPPPARIDDDLEIHDIRFTGRQPWVRETTAWLRQIHSRFWLRVSDVLARGLLTEEEARGLAPRLDVRVRDERGDRRRALPALPAVDPENPWAERPRPRRRDVR